MPNSVRFGTAISTAALACAIAGCAAPQSRVSSASFGGKADGEIGLAMRAMAALNANNLPLAVNLAERAVARTPNDAGFRALLGNAYFSSGRFASAEAAYKDSLAIYSNQPATVLKLALVEIAQGKSAEAVAFLEAARGVLDPADYGLALALAGRAPDAVQVLHASARQPGADARVRQNLALAYALSGDWSQARTVAAQDLAANQVDARIKQWMLFAKPARASDQVASLTGVTPVAADPGQPVRLALRKGGAQLALATPQPQPVAAPAPAPAPEPQQYYSTPEPAPAPAAEISQAIRPSPPPADPARVAAFAPEPQPEVAVALPPPPPADPVRVVTAAVAEIAAAAFDKFAPPAFKPAAPRKASAPRKAAKLYRAAAATVRPAVLRRGGSTAVVQLGAYGSSQRVLAAWNSAARRYTALRAYAPMSARFNTGRETVYRLSVRGFASQAEAARLCAALRRSGGACFVRTVAGDAPVQIASR